MASQWSLPTGLARLWVAELGVAEAEALARSLTRPAPVTLRANMAVTGREDLMRSLRSSGVGCRPGQLSPWAITLTGTGRASWGGSVWSLDPWRAGGFEVQDEGSQCIVLACEPSRSECVVDLCAGNGGKTLALAAAVGRTGSVVASDVVASRLAALRASAERATVQGWVRTVLVESDEADTEPERCARGSSQPSQPPHSSHPSHPLQPSQPPQPPQPSQPPPSLSSSSASSSSTIERRLREAVRDAGGEGGADVVLVDAPCSSSGVLRRHPGLRWSGSWADTTSWAGTPLMELPTDERAAEGKETGEVARIGSVPSRAPTTEEETRRVPLQTLPELQALLLRRALSLVRPGGRLVYATCALDPRENEQVADAFEAEFGSLLRPWPFADGTPGRHGGGDDDARRGRQGRAIARGRAAAAGPASFVSTARRVAHRQSQRQQHHYRTLWPHRHGTDGFFIARWQLAVEGAQGAGGLTRGFPDS